MKDESANPATPETAGGQLASALFGEDATTGRGFGLVKFCDEYGEKCSLQISSRAACENEDGTVDDPLGWVWLGIDDAKPQIMKTKARELGLPLPPGEVSGWMPYPVPDDVLMTTRMHLNEEQVRGLIARLQTWLEHGQFSTPNRVMSRSSDHGNERGMEYGYENQGFMAAEMEDRQVTQTEKLDAIAALYKAVYNATESFCEGGAMVGQTLYLIGAIVKDGTIELTRNDPYREFLRGLFPPYSGVWNHVGETD